MFESEYGGWGRVSQPISFISPPSLKCVAGQCHVRGSGSFCWLTPGEEVGVSAAFRPLPSVFLSCNGLANSWNWSVIIGRTASNSFLLRSHSQQQEVLGSFIFVQALSATPPVTAEEPPGYNSSENWIIFVPQRSAEQASKLPLPLNNYQTHSCASLLRTVFHSFFHTKLMFSLHDQVGF